MYKRPPGSWHAILTDYIANFAPSDYVEMGISPHTLSKAANPLEPKRTLSIDHIIVLENWRADHNLPQFLYAWVQDNINKSVPAKASYESLIDHLSHAKKEADDVSTEAFKLLADGSANIADLRILEKEGCEAEVAIKALNLIIKQKINDKVNPANDARPAE